MGTPHRRTALACLAVVAAAGTAAAPASADVSGRTSSGTASVQLSSNYLTIQIHRKALARALGSRPVVIVCGRGTLGPRAAVHERATWTPSAVGPARFSYTFGSTVEGRVDRCGVRKAGGGWYLKARLK
jgi:hypothetical protein